VDSAALVLLSLLLAVPEALVAEQAVPLLPVQAVPETLQAYRHRKAATAAALTLLHQTMVVAEAAGRLLLAQMELVQPAVTVEQVQRRQFLVVPLLMRAAVAAVFFKAAHRGLVAPAVAAEAAQTAMLVLLEPLTPGAVAVVEVTQLQLNLHRFALAQQAAPASLSSNTR
jgi:hypothetical protein